MSDRDVMPPGTETCRCCEGIGAGTPMGVDNRSGLSAIGYRIGEYAQFKQSMLAGLSSSDRPELSGLRTRESDDYTLGLIDAVACVADVLTFYQERLANESYLRTATERVSLQEMAKLIGYRLRPGVAAETWLAFALEVPKTPPPNLMPEPGAFVTGIPKLVTLASGLKVQSVPGPDEKPQTFETVEDVVARPEWNAMPVLRDEDVVPGFGATQTWLAGADTQLKPGDALLFVGAEFLTNPSSERWDVRIISGVAPDAAAQRTLITWREPLGSVSPLVHPSSAPTIFALRQRAAIFGNNAPAWAAMSDEFKAAYLGLENRDKLTQQHRVQWPQYDIYAPGDRPEAQVISLDRAYPSVLPGSYAVLMKPDYTELFQVTAVNEMSRAEFAMSGKSALLTLRGENLTLFASAVRETAVLAQSEALPRARTPITRPVTGAFIDVTGSLVALAAGRRVIIQGRRADTGTSFAHAATVVAWTIGADRCTAQIDPPLPVALRRGGTVVFGNVALATHGETTVQILGAGDSSKGFQRFELKRLPLTYRSAANETGADSELSVRIGDVEWTEKPTLFGAASNERAYTLSVDEQGRVWVVFGEGVHGARIPTGVNNVRAKYRHGLGYDGNVGSDQLTQLMSRPLGLKSVSNPIAAEGGNDPEPAHQARRTMPLGTRTLGRAVSLLDYEDFAMAFTGVAKAQARVLHLSAGPSIGITIVGQGGAVLSGSNPIWKNLWLALKAGGDPHANVVLLPHQPSTFRIGLKVKRDARYELRPLLTAVEAGLRTHYAFDARELGQPVLQSDVVAVVHSVPGVMAVDVDFLYGGTSPAVQTLKSRRTRVLASRMRVSNGVALPAELLTLDAAPLDRLEEMT